MHQPSHASIFMFSLQLFLPQKLILDLDKYISIPLNVTFLVLTIK